MCETYSELPGAVHETHERVSRNQWRAQNPEHCHVSTDKLFHKGREQPLRRDPPPLQAVSRKSRGERILRSEAVG